MSGRRLVRASSAPAVRSRSRISSQRPVSRKKTNIVSESKNTSAPSGPVGSKVPAELTMKVMAIPNAAGRSMLMRPCRRSRQAFVKNGPHEKNITGNEITQEAQRSSCTMSSVISPGSAV